VEILQFLLQLLSILRKVSPNMETCIIELVKSRRVKANLQQYCAEINNFTHIIKKKKKSIADLRFRIDFRIRVTSEVFHTLDDVKECFQDFPNYEIVKSPELSI